MNIQDKQELEHIFDSIKVSDLSLAIKQLREYVSSRPYLMFDEILNAIEEDFNRMLDYMQNGYNDPERDKYLQKLKHRIYILAKNIRISNRKQHEFLFMEAKTRSLQQSFSHDRIKNMLENFVGDVAMLSLDSHSVSNEKAAMIYRNHHDFVSRLFDYILISEQWKQSDAEFYEQLLLSPTIDIKDSMLIVSAISIANMTEFDENKFYVLLNLYTRSSSNHIRQRAFTGWVLSLRYNESPTQEFKDRIRQVCNNEETINEIIEMQKQMVFCMNAEKDNKVIEREIMPTLINNSNISITRNGIIEKEDSPLEDILSPDAADKKMNEVEDSIQKIAAMQRSGSDIFFSGFAQMKRFSFFYTLSNWFTPFYPEHPDMNKSANLDKFHFIEKMMSSGPFCDSDKYSFALSMATVVDKIPKDMQEMFRNADENAFGPMISDGADHKGNTYIRRMYLQDLYRFYRLHPEHKSLENPFSTKNYLFVTNDLLNVPALKKQIYDLASFFNKQQIESAIKEILDKYDDESNTHYLMLKGMHELTYNKNYEEAYKYYKKLFDIDPNNVNGKNGLARACMELRQYNEAVKLYDELREAYPKKKSHKLNYCLALTKQKRYDEAVAELYRLDYEMPDDINVMRLLAWGLMGQEKLEQAEKTYNKILIHDKHNAADYLNAGYCKWFKGDIETASDMLVSFSQGTNITSLMSELYNDIETLEEHGITESDIILMYAIVNRKIQRNGDSM